MPTTIRDLFDREAGHYEEWYATARGRRVTRGEGALLDRLLAAFPQARTILDVGCGTGHFTARLAARGLSPLALDCAPGMLDQLRRRLPGCPTLRADAHALPLPDGAVDLVAFMTTLEFLESAERALGEAVRVARSGVLAILLNRCSLGALSRRWGRSSRSALLGRARDDSLRRVRRLIEAAAGARLVRLASSTALLPYPLPPGPTAIPFGDLIGIAAVLEDSDRRSVEATS